MPYDPNLPQENTLIDAAQMRAQLQALKAFIDARATQAELTNAVNAALATALNSSSNNSNAVGTLGLVADSNYNPAQMQATFDKLVELINTLRR